LVVVVVVVVVVCGEVISVLARVKVEEENGFFVEVTFLKAL
jgi:hypothetical protein